MTLMIPVTNTFITIFCRRFEIEVIRDGLYVFLLHNLTQFAFAKFIM